MRIIPLREIASRTFRKQNLAELYKNEFNLSVKDWLAQPSNFIMAAKSCDGSYHSVNSDIAEVVAEQAENIKRGKIKDTILKLLPSDPIHGDRFVIFKSDAGNHFFLGTVESAFMTLAEGK